MTEEQEQYGADEYRIYKTDFVHFYGGFMILAAICHKEDAGKIIGEVDVFCLWGGNRHKATSVIAESGIIDNEAMFEILVGVARGLIEEIRMKDATEQNNQDIQIDLVNIRVVKDASSHIPLLVYNHTEYRDKLEKISKESVSNALRERLQLSLSMNITFSDIRR